MVGQRRHDGLLHDAEDLLVIAPADAEAADQYREAIDDAPAQFLQVLEEAHAGHLFGSALLRGFDHGTGHRYSLPVALPARKAARRRHRTGGVLTGSGSTWRQSSCMVRLTVSVSGLIIRSHGSSARPEAEAGPGDLRHAFFARSSSSMFIISVSSWFLNSLLARLNSASNLPSWRPAQAVSWAQDDQGQQENKDHLWHAEVHRFIIMRRRSLAEQGLTR